MSDTNVYYISEIIGTKSICELDFALQDSLGFDYKANEDFVEIEKGYRKSYETYEATSIKIDDLIGYLEEAKKKGANYVEIEDHCDHHGYEISFLNIRPADQSEIDDYEKEEKEKRDAVLNVRKSLLLAELSKLEKEK